MKFNRMLSDFGICQHVLAPTHNRGGLLDYIITRKDEQIQNVAVVDVGLSDHRFIVCDIDISLPTPVYDTVVGLSWRRFDVDAFHRELNASI